MNLLEKIDLTLFTLKRKYFGRKRSVLRRSVSLIAVILSLPIAIYLLHQGYLIIRSAVVGNAVISLSPTTATKRVGAKGQIDVFLNPQGEKVTGTEIYLTYDPLLIQITDIKPGKFFTNTALAIGTPEVLIKNIVVPGKAHYAIAFPPGSKFTSTTSNNIAIIYYTTLATGTSPITLTLSGNPYTVVTGDNGQNLLQKVINSQVIVSKNGK